MCKYFQTFFQIIDKPGQLKIYSQDLVAIPRRVITACINPVEPVINCVE